MATERLMTKQEIRRGLNLLAVGSRERRGSGQRIPMTLIASCCGLSRIAVWRARQGEISDRVQQLLSPLLQDALAGKIKCYWHRTHWDVEFCYERGDGKTRVPLRPGECAVGILPTA